MADLNARSQQPSILVIGENPDPTQNRGAFVDLFLDSSLWYVKKFDTSRAWDYLAAAWHVATRDTPVPWAIPYGRLTSETTAEVRFGGPVVFGNSAARGYPWQRLMYATTLLAGAMVHRNNADYRDALTTRISEGAARIPIYRGSGDIAAWKRAGMALAARIDRTRLSQILESVLIAQQCGWQCPAGAEKDLVHQICQELLATNSDPSILPRPLRLAMGVPDETE